MESRQFASYMEKGYKMRIIRTNKPKGYLTTRNFAHIDEERKIKQLADFYDTDAWFMDKATSHLGECLSCLARIKDGKFTEYDDSVAGIDKIYYQLLHIARKLDEYERALYRFREHKEIADDNDPLALKQLVEDLMDKLTAIDPNEYR